MTVWKLKMKSVSQRTLSVFMSLLIFVTMFASVLAGVFVAIASNPTHTGALNTYVPVEYVNLKPVAVGTTSYVDDNGEKIDNVPSRTTYSKDSYADYMDITVQTDEVVRFDVKNKYGPTSASDTTYISTKTQVNQMINLQEYPFFMLSWETSARVNGYINFTFTKGDKEYFIKNLNDTDFSNDAVAEVPASKEEITPSDTTYANSAFSFYQIAGKTNSASDPYNAYVKESDADKNDFPEGKTRADYSVDLYAFLYDYFNKHGWTSGTTNYWPDWKNGDYITINYVTHTIISDDINTALFAKSYIEWNTCGIGRLSLNKYSTLAPRMESVVKYGHYITGSDEVLFDGTPGRSARLDDGTYVFRNTSSTKSAVFNWPVERYINVNELRSIYLDASLTNATEDIVLALAVMGENYTGNSSSSYVTAGYWEHMANLVENYSDKTDMTLSKKYSDVTVNFYNAIRTEEVKEGSPFNYPDDHMIRIREIRLTLPPNAKFAIKKFSVLVEDEFAPSTTSDTVYPWATSNVADTLPPAGTPATSDLLDTSTGAYSAAYNWAATVTPTVEHKVDLLSMTDQHVLYDNTGRFEGFETSDVTGYWRTMEGKSHFTSKSSDIVYRAFRRRDKNAGPSDTEDSSNYYMEIPVSSMPYLYYSYTLNGGNDKAVGLYFNIVNGKTYKHYYLGQSGLALSACDGIMDSTDADVATAHKALCSSADARTGVIDLRSIGFNDGDIIQILDMRFYLTGTSTEAVFDYLFFGSEALKDSVKNTIAKNSGDAFPWAITHDQFKNATLGTNAQFTFANRLDLIRDMFDRKKWNLKGGTYNTGDEYKACGSELTHNSDGSITVTASANQRYVQVGTSFDHLLAFNINKSDLASIRYLNYSVNAQPGMRWSILLMESNTESEDTSTDDLSGVALRTWSDAMMSGDFKTNSKNAGETVGKSYLREMSQEVFYNYWFNGEHKSTNAEDEAWAMFTVPGSETGCFDLSQIQSVMDWDKIVSIYFIVYRDPSLKNDAGTASVGGSVTFNYAYLTSEPLTGGSFGTAPLTTGDSYSWGYNGGNITWKGNPVSTFDLANGTTTTWSSTSGCTDYYFSGKTALNLTNYHKQYYSIYYSFNFRDKQGNLAYPEVLYGFFDKNSNYKQITRYAHLGKAEVYPGDETHRRDAYAFQMPQSGAIAISALSFDNLYSLRVYYDVNKYTIYPEYAVIAYSSTYTAEGRNTQPKALTSLSSKTADFSESLYQTDTGIQKVVTNEGGSEFTTNKNYSKNIVVDLNRTPYLFYSIKYTPGASGSFAFGTDVSINGQNGFYRDGTQTEQASKTLLQPGVTPPTAKYMPESETGCIDVRSWLQRQGALPSNGKITINHFYAYVTGGTAKYYYMYFGAEADKTIDLLPAQAGADLDNGVSTHSSVMETNNTCEVEPPVDNTPTPGESFVPDRYIEKAHTPSNVALPTMVSSLPGDRNEDGYNDLIYSNTQWGFYSVCYGEIQTKDKGEYTYVTTANNQMSGLTINLNETPYLHFSISQPDTSLTTFLLQLNSYTGRDVIRGMSPEEVKPWLSCYNSKSPAGQLMHISPQTSYITYYKDTAMEYYNGTYETGDFAGVIDLRRWFTETNGCGDIISLERVRFYTPDPKVAGKQAENVTVNHFYLSSSCGSAYSITFDKNDGSDQKHTVQILKNANDQFVSDAIADELGFKERPGYTFVGWYTDEDWEEYFDIQNTPIRENMRLYAGWLNNADVVETGEVDMLQTARDAFETSGSAAGASDGVYVTGNGKWETDEDALHLRNTGDKDFVITFDVKKAYSLYDFRSVYVGMDVATSMQANVDLTDESRTSDGARIVMDLKSLGSHEYDFLGADFGTHFLTDNRILTAAPYDKQLPVYTLLANRDLLPVKENVNGYVYVKTISFTVPAGCAMHIRYATAAKPMDESLDNVVAPEITGTILDLMDPKGDEGYVEQLHNTTYELLEEPTVIYNRTTAPTGLKQATVSGVNIGYVTLGSLYGLGNPLGEFEVNADNPQYLYFSISQGEQSSTTFNMWASIFYTSSTKTGSFHPDKWSTFFDGRDGKLHSQKDLDNGSIPAGAFAHGTVMGQLNLYEWYADALQAAIASGELPSDAKVTHVRITGIRLYTANSGTEATFNYLAIGGKDNTDESMRAKAAFVNASGATVEEQISDVDFGQTVKLTLDQLEHCSAAHDPSQSFVGWSFTGTDAASVVYWNPNATNDREYTASNTNGAWSRSFMPGFVKDRRDISYQLTDYTQIIRPVFASDKTVSVTVNVNGTGNVRMLRPDGNAVQMTDGSSVSEIFGSTVALTALSDGFCGWYDEGGRLVSASRDYVCTLYSDVSITADYSRAFAPMTPFFNGNGELFGDGYSVVWLQAGDEAAGQAGDDFSLQAVNSGELSYETVSASDDLEMPLLSNTDDVTGDREIACYWEIENGQMVDAVAPNNYHWEQIVADGTRVRVSESNMYRFVTDSNIRLVCISDTAASSTPLSDTRVIANDYAVAFDRTGDAHNATIRAQVLTAEGESIVSCGFVMANRPTRVRVPSYESPESQRYEATAWNSTTGQFTVSVDYVPGMARFIRAYAITQDRDGHYKLTYSDVRTVSF